MRALNVPLHLVMRTMAPITARITTLAVASSHLKPRVVGPIALSAGAAGQVLRRACCRCRPETSERIISSAVKYRRSLVSRLIIALPFAWETPGGRVTQPIASEPAPSPRPWAWSTGATRPSTTTTLPLPLEPPGQNRTFLLGVDSKFETRPSGKQKLGARPASKRAGTRT